MRIRSPPFSFLPPGANFSASDRKKPNPLPPAEYSDATYACCVAGVEGGGGGFAVSGTVYVCDSLRLRAQRLGCSMRPRRLRRSVVGKLPGSKVPRWADLR